MDGCDHPDESRALVEVGEPARPLEPGDPLVETEPEPPCPSAKRHSTKWSGRPSVVSTIRSRRPLRSMRTSPPVAVPTAMEPSASLVPRVTEFFRRYSSASFGQGRSPSPSRRKSPAVRVATRIRDGPSSGISASIRSDANRSPPGTGRSSSPASSSRPRSISRTKKRFPTASENCSPVGKTPAPYPAAGPAEELSVRQDEDPVGGRVEPPDLAELAVVGVEPSDERNESHPSRVVPLEETEISLRPDPDRPVGVGGEPSDEGLARGRNDPPADAVELDDSVAVRHVDDAATILDDVEVLDVGAVLAGAEGSNRRSPDLAGGIAAGARRGDGSGAGQEQERREKNSPADHRARIPAAAPRGRRPEAEGAAPSPPGPGGWSNRRVAAYPRLQAGTGGGLTRNRRRGRRSGRRVPEPAPRPGVGHRTEGDRHDEVSPCVGEPPRRRREHPARSAPPPHRRAPRRGLRQARVHEPDGRQQGPHREVHDRGGREGRTPQAGRPDHRELLRQHGPGPRDGGHPEGLPPEGRRPRPDLARRSSTSSWPWASRWSRPTAPCPPSIPTATTT